MKVVALYLYPVVLVFALSSYFFNSVTNKNNSFIEKEFTSSFSELDYETFELRINAGGQDVTYNSKTFEADKYFSGNGKSFTNNKIIDIAGTTNDKIYLSERSTTKNLGSFSYSIPLENGDYTLDLHFAEIWFGATGSGPGGSGRRVFDVVIEGQKKLINFDINDEVGTMTALIKTFEIEVLDGELNLDFSASINQPKLSALEILGKEPIPDEPPPPAPPTSTVKRINAGGPEQTFDGDVFEADQYFLGDLRSYSNNKISDIKNTDKDVLYLTERTTSSNSGEFAYAIPLENGAYEVKLHFAEIYWGATGGGSGGNGKRVFSVKMEGLDILVNYDINLEVGTMTAIIKSFPLNLNDGILDLEFTSSVNRPKLSAIEILSSSPDPVEPPEDELRLLTRINSGGEELLLNNMVFEKDKYFTGEGKPYKNTKITDIKNTALDAIYLSERSTLSNLGKFGYAIPVTNGTYEIKLHFAEIYWGATGGGSGGTNKRVFNVSIENDEVLSGFDLNKEVGSMTAVVKTFTAVVVDGEINIGFSASINQPKLSAMEIFGTGELLEVQDCEWQDLADSSYERLESQSAKVNSKLYVIAGFKAGLKISNELEIYDPVNNTWSLGAPIPIGVTHMGIAVVGAEIWILAGFVGNHPGVATNRVQIYNTIDNNWRDGPDLPFPRGSGTAAFSNGKIHFFGGLKPDRKTDVGEHFILDVNNQNNGWVQAASMPNPRNHLSAASINGVIYAIGGQYGHDGGVKDQKFLHAYDPNSDTWTRKKDLPTNRSHFEPGTTINNGKILIAGGRNGGFFFDDILEYNPANDSWTTFCELPYPLLAPVAKVFGDKFVITNGGIGGTCCPINTTQWIPILPEPSVEGLSLKENIPEQSSTEINIFPNPSTGLFYLDIGAKNDEVTITVTNLSAEVIEVYNYKEDEIISFNLNHPPGIYIVQVKTASGLESVQKIIKL